MRRLLVLLVAVGLALAASLAFAWMPDDVRNKGFFETREEAAAHLFKDPVVNKQELVTRGLTRGWNSRARSVQSGVPPLEAPESGFADLHAKAETVPNILFDFDRSVPSPAMIRQLDIIGPLLQEGGSRFNRIYLGGYADPDGDEGYNMLLSKRRALFVRDYLADIWHLDRDLFQVEAFGASRILFWDRDRYKYNRRVEIVAR